MRNCLFKSRFSSGTLNVSTTSSPCHRPSRRSLRPLCNASTYKYIYIYIWPPRSAANHFPGRWSLTTLWSVAHTAISTGCVLTMQNKVGFEVMVSTWNCLAHFLSLSLSLLHTLFHTQTHSQSPRHWLSLSLSHTHTHRHTLLFHTHKVYITESPSLFHRLPSLSYTISLFVFFLHYLLNIGLRLSVVFYY